MAEARPPATEGSDWTAQAADLIERVVGSVRHNTTARATWLAKALVYGLLAVVMATTALVLFTILGLRLLNAYLPGDVWAAYLLLGGLFTLAGMLLWSFRTGKAKE